jgi:hypothetical protein
VSTLKAKAAIVALSIVAAIALAFYLMVHRVQRLHNDTCAGLTAIASDGQKMERVKAWLASRMSDKDFMDAVRQNRYFEPGDPRLQKYIDLDWRYLGFVPEYASLVFNSRNIERHDFDAGEIESVSLGQGRSSIIIRLGSAEDLGLRWPAQEAKKMKAVRADVFVYCEYQR